MDSKRVMRVQLFLPPLRKEYPVPSDFVSRSRGAGRLCGEAQCVDVNNGVGRGNRLASEVTSCSASEHLDQMCSHTLFYTVHAIFCEASLALHSVIIYALLVIWLPA